MSDVLYCSNCYAENKADSKFCIKCGTKLFNNIESDAVPFEPAETVTVFDAAKGPEAAAFEPATATTVFEPAETATITEPSEPTVTVSSVFEPAEETATVTSAFETVVIPAEEKKEETPAFAPVKESVNDVQEEKSAFAEGLPEWSLEPPMIAVRRK